MCRVGRSSIDVLGTFNLSHKIKTVQSIAKTLRNDYVLGTQAGVCFGRWLPQEKQFEVIGVTPGTTSSPLTFLAGRQTVKVEALEDDYVLAADYNQPGYYLINRATKDIRKLEEAITDNRGCFDLVPLPNFSLQDFPFCLAKGINGITLLNLATYETYEIIKTQRGQGNSYCQKLSCKRKRNIVGAHVANKLDMVVTHVEHKEGRTIVEQLDLPELFIRALSLNGQI